MTSIAKKGCDRGIYCFFIFLWFFVLSGCSKGLALDRKISSALSHYIMAVMYDDLGQVDKAIKEYKQALRTDKENTVIHLNLAVSYIRDNQIDNAIDELNVTAQLDPEAVEPHAILAFLYSLQSKAEAANQEYEIALKNASKLNPENKEIYKNLIVLYLQEGKFQAAEEMCKVVLDVSKDDAQIYFYLANIYERIKTPKDTEEALRKAIELDPDYHEALNYLGYFYIEENKNLEEARGMIEKALKAEPDNGAYLDSLGWYYFKKDKLDKAIEILSKASLLLEDAVIFDHLGDAYFKAGDTEKAKLNWQKSLEIEPEQDKVKEKLHVLNQQNNAE